MVLHVIMVLFSCDYGFIIDRKESGTIISVKRDGTSLSYSMNRQSYYLPGNYEITYSAPLGSDYTANIKVRHGLITRSIPANISLADGDADYTFDNIVNTISSGYTYSSYSKISVAADYDERVVSNNNDNYSDVGVTGSNAFVLLSLSPDALRSNYEIVSDDYGQYETELIDGMNTGKIESGCLIIKKRANESDSWQFANSGIYSGGLFTTDYENQFGYTNTLIYTPSGEDILKGTYYQFIYVFKVHNIPTDTYKRVVEIHEIYLCSDSVESVLFHNLTTYSTIAQEISEENTTTVATQYDSRFESLTDGSETRTGFKIDKAYNPNVTISIKRNGTDIDIPSDGEIKQHGRYDISVVSKLDTKRDLTIYVNKLSNEKLYELYFSENFLSGKRIYDEGKYPVYIGGETSYKINGLNDTHQYLWGTINNGETITEINSGSDDVSETLFTAGEYVVTLNTNATYKTDEKSGDNHVIVFHFTIKPGGTTSNPRINKANLEELNSQKYPTNLRPVYYGLTFSSAKSGNITLAFADKETAMTYAYNYEGGLVEEVDGAGNYRYKGPYKVSGQKVVYNSIWDITDARYYFAEQAVETLYIDLSDPFTYRTLKDEVIADTDNLRKLELDKSVTIIAEGELEKLLVKTELPLINSRKERIYSPVGTDEEIIQPFMFIKDKYGYDSFILSIRDSKGNTYPINYNQSVEEQLKELGFETGIIEINEYNIYNELTTYYAIYISEDDNNQVSKIEYYVDEQKHTEIFTKQNNGTSLKVSKFKLLEIVDEFDPYGLVLIEHAGIIESYAINDLDDKEYTNEGTYKIRFVNRLGYDYSINLIIEKNKYISIVLVDEKNNTRIITEKCYIEDRIPLTTPNPVTGYDFLGYVDELGRVYINSVKAKELTDGTILTAVWSLKQIKVTLIINGEVYENITVSYGDTINLNDYIPNDNDEFEGWLLDGEEITNLVINGETDITLNAKLHEVEKPNNNGSKSNNAPLIIGIIVGSIALLSIGAVLLIIIKKRHS